ncbi:MAG: Tex family protein [Planctomycetota bacterium]|jgi:uncharacterized protein
MSEKYVIKIAKDLGISEKQVAATIELLEEGGTVPFIARYRKEATGTLDEVEITNIRDQLGSLKELDKRREAIIKSLTERELLTDELSIAIEGADNLSTLEDIYLPYKPKRKTRATAAREKGLEPLADMISKQQNDFDVEREAQKYIDEEKEVTSIDDALQGARDIIAETINEDASVRDSMRKLFEEKALIASKVAKGKDEEGAKFKDYFEWSEIAANSPSHRILAMFRGEKEGFLKLNIRPEENQAHSLIQSAYLKNKSKSADQVNLAIIDSYNRLLAPSMENEMRQLCKEEADNEAIKVFADNIRELLMSAPLGQKRVLAIDPGFRTGCKTVILDEQGKLLGNTTLYMTSSEKGKREAEEQLISLCEKFKIEAIAIGNGTASRESESFIKGIKLPGSPLVVMVNESGASIYSASETAREEFPDQDLTVRGSVSIGRRLMDPLAELVKIDPKSIGVGQYQHDVDQGNLKNCLDDVVMSCVNAVGVEVNTSSKELLTYVSGLGPQLAGNIVKHRNENGPFKSRSALKKVARLGPKAFEQAAGFLRIRDAKNPLDMSAVHPERYDIVKRMAKDQNCSILDLIKDSGLRENIDLNKYKTDEVGLPTLTDIVEELAKPGRDPRESFEAFSFAEGINEVKDLEPGMQLPGIVTNVTKFGAFVDIGVHQDGLVHISELADSYISDPADFVKVQQKVTVTVMEIDEARNRISLSMRENPGEKRSQNKAAAKPVKNKEEKKVQQSSNSGGGANWLKEALKK